jgi:hypothetical protein
LGYRIRTNGLTTHPIISAWRPLMIIEPEISL